MKKVLKIALIGILAVLTLLSSFACAPTGGGTTKDGLLYKKEYLTMIRKFGFTESDEQKPLRDCSVARNSHSFLLPSL